MTYEAAALRCTVDSAIEQAALYVIVSSNANAADVGTATDGDTAHAVGNGTESAALTHNASSASGGAAVAGDNEVTDGGNFDIAEQRCPRFVVVTRVVNG